MELQQPDGSYEVVTIPDGLRVGDRFDVDVSEGSRTRGTWEVSDDEAKCLDLRFTAVRQPLGRPYMFQETST